MILLHTLSSWKGESVLGRLFYKTQYRDLLLGAALLGAAAALLRWPQESMQAAREGLRLCGNVIIPSLFPFFVLSSLVVELGMSRYLGKLLEHVMYPLFRVNGACASALALGFVGGYPVGAKTAISLYQNGQCSKTEAERLLAFCNNSGPAFVLGVVGAGIFGSGTVGLILYLTHIAASLLVGLLFRFYKPGEAPKKAGQHWDVQAVAFAPAFTRSVSSALTSALNICAFVLFFTVFIRCLSLSGFLPAASGLLAAVFSPLGLTQPQAQQLLTGLLEVSSGVSSLTGDGMLSGRLSLAAFMLGWAGLSVHCQVLAFLGDCGLSMRTYFWGKLLHGGLSAALTAWVLSWLDLEQPAASYLAQQVEALAGLDLGRCLALSILCAWGMWLAFFLLAARMTKKSSGKGRRHAL